MSKLNKTNQEGYVLVFTLLLLVVLTLLGVSAIDTSIFESNMAANDALYKRAFYQADGGTEMGMRLAYDNAICIQVNNDGFDDSGEGTRNIGNVKVYDLNFSLPEEEMSETPTSLEATDGVDYRDVAYYTEGLVGDDTTPHTNLLFKSEVKFTAGSGLQMVSGYDGLGASSIGGGSHMEFEIISRHLGARNSEALVTLGWRMSTHMLNSASSSDCNSVYVD